MSFSPHCFRDRCCYPLDIKLIKPLCNLKVQIWRWVFDFLLWSIFIEIIVWTSAKIRGKLETCGPRTDSFFTDYWIILLNHKVFFSDLLMATACFLDISSFLCAGAIEWSWNEHPSLHMGWPHPSISTGGRVGGCRKHSHVEDRPNSLSLPQPRFYMLISKAH